MMNKISVLLMFFGLFFALGCSKSDDNADVDLVGSLAYRPLESLEELGKKQYEYVGIKVGDRKVGLLPSNTSSCSQNDKLEAQFTDDKFERIVFYRMSKNCKEKKEVRLVRNILVKEGILHTIVVGSIDDVSKLAIDEEGRIALEIGFQGDYLRIEDRMSNFKRTKHNEKVYLYFKRKDI